MTTTEQLDALDALLAEAAQDAAAFRTHPIYDSEGDGFMLTKTADRIDALIADARRVPALEAEVARLTAENGKLRRCLMPVWMTLAEREMAGEPLAADARVLSFMGSGASDFVTAGEIRAALGAA